MNARETYLDEERGIHTKRLEQIALGILCVSSAW